LTLLSLQQPDLSKDLVGGKAANISRMLNMGLNVPTGFVCTTNHCFEKKFDRGEKFEAGDYFHHSLMSNIRFLADNTDTTWTLDEGKPLVVSVRSGAPISMPGMMDTILNIGLTKTNINRFVESLGATREFGLDCYRRLIQMFGVTVKGVDPKLFNEIYDAAKIYYGEFDEEVYEILVNFFEEIYRQEVGEEFPDDPNIQLLEACNAVYSSWFSEKAVSYRKIEKINPKMGTAVTVQQMVFGNLDSSATGVVFTHNPNTGEKGIYGDYLKKAQGEDVVAGTHKVFPIAKMFEDEELLKPARELQAAMSKLFQNERDILDIEFTIERGKLYLLQYRVPKRSQRASVRSIIDMSREGVISSVAATEKFLSLLPKMEAGSSDPGNLKYIGSGIGATDGTVVGQIALSHEQADELAEEGTPFIYVAMETNPEDITQMKNSVGILTALGGKLSHAAVVARGWDKSCVVSLEGLVISQDATEFTYKDISYAAGAWIKINGSSGEVWA